MNKIQFPIKGVTGWSLGDPSFFDGCQVGNFPVKFFETQSYQFGIIILKYLPTHFSPGVDLKTQP